MDLASLPFGEEVFAWHCTAGFTCFSYGSSQMHLVLDMNWRACILNLQEVGNGKHHVHTHTSGADVPEMLSMSGMELPETISFSELGWVLQGAVPPDCGTRPVDPLYRIQLVLSCTLTIKCICFKKNAYLSIGTEFQASPMCQAGRAVAGAISYVPCWHGVVDCAAVATNKSHCVSLVTSSTQTHTHFSNIYAWAAFISKCWCVKCHTSFLGLWAIFPSLLPWKTGTQQILNPVSFFFVQMPSGRSFYACKTGGISTKLPGIRPFAFYGKTNRSSRGHIQNDCEKCDGGKFWLPASGCSHVFVPVDENHTDSRADILAQQPCAHVETLQIESALGSREEQTVHAVSHRPCPGWGHSWGTKAACLVWLLAFLSPNLSPKLEGLALIFRALVSMLI